MSLVDAIRRRSRRFARPLQAAVAVLGLAALLDAVARLPFEGGPPLPSTRRFFAVWCVAVPYWFYIEYTFLLERDASGRPTTHACRLQRLSWTVWLGGAVALGAFVAGG